MWGFLSVTPIGSGMDMTAGETPVTARIIGVVAQNWRTQPCMDKTPLGYGEYREHTVK